MLILKIKTNMSHEMRSMGSKKCSLKDIMSKAKTSEIGQELLIMLCMQSKKRILRYEVFFPKTMQEHRWTKPLGELVDLLF